MVTEHLFNRIRAPMQCVIVIIYPLRQLAASQRKAQCIKHTWTHKNLLKIHKTHKT